MSLPAPKVLVLIGLIGFAHLAFAVEPPDMPHHLVLVGVVRTPDNAQVAGAITNTAEGAGYRVEVLSGSDSAAHDWLADEAQLDVLVRPTWDPSAKEATVLIFFRGFSDPRWIRRVGSDATRAAGAAVVEILSGSALMLAPLAAPTNAANGSAIDRGGVRDDVLEALRLMGASKYTEALAFLERAEAGEPNDTQILYNLALCNQKLGDEEQMRTYIERANRLDPRHSGINILLGNEALARGQLADAVAHYEIARQSPAAASIANWNLAVVYNRMGRTEKVHEHLLTVSDTSAQAFDAQKWLALIDAKVEEVRKASEARTKWLARAGVIAFGALTVMLGLGVWMLVKKAKLARKELLMQLLPTLASAILAAVSAVLPKLLGTVG